ncbi:hypothetical protein [Demequina sp. NBRC 110056]|uniref:hypothetical protein n=1 Tax=Demequina sp. NBRC 110056 TaxID=1570345 RepID=UPI000A00543A|nr:hypothetical protein [Demequina sp. NBRC 110056]
MPMWQLVAIGLIPSIAVAALFWFAMRAVVRADRNERAALAQIEEDDARSVQGAPSDRSADARAESVDTVAEPGAGPVAESREEPSARSEA